MTVNPHHLIMFVKAPVPGKVKTRLTPAYSHEESAKLYRGWVREIYTSVRALNVDLKIAYEAQSEFPTPEWIASQASIDFFYQSGKTLGERLKHAFSQAFKAGARRVVAIGSDSPGLPVEFVAEAFSALQSNDVALGPTPDGGYYLAGLSRLLPDLFENISWSSAQVYGETVKVIREARYSLHVLPEYFDIDYPEDLKRVENVPSNGKVFN